MQHYGHTEAECLAHTEGWLNFMLDQHAKEELARIRVAGQIQLRAAFLTAVAMNDGEKGAEMFEQMSHGLMDDGKGEDAHLSDPHAETDVATLAQFLQRKSDEQAKPAG